MSEATIRAAADKALGARIDKEVAARVAGDTALASKIAALEADMANTILRVSVLEAHFEPPAPPDPLPPVAAFNATPTTGLIPLSVAFADTSTGGAVASWAWAFGDGATSTAQNPTHVYAAAGSYTATLTATNATGSSGPVSRVISAFVNPPVPPPVGKVVNVASIAALKSALADNTVDEIVVANGTYAMGGSSLDIGSAYAGRTRAVLVRAQTTGGVTLNLGGSSVHMLFRDGAHHQTWQGFKFGDSTPYDCGVIQFGAGTNAPCHDITLRDIEFLSTIVQPAGPGGNYQNGQGIYLNSASGGGNYNIVVDGFVSNAQLWAHIHAYGKGGGNVNCHDVTIRNMQIVAAHKAHNQMGIVLWDATLANIVIEDVTISDANEYGVRHAAGGTGIVLRRITTTSSGAAGFYSSLGSYPSVSGITFDSCSFG